MLVPKPTVEQLIADHEYLKEWEVTQYAPVGIKNKIFHCKSNIPEAKQWYRVWVKNEYGWFFEGLKEESIF